MGYQIIKKFVCKTTKVKINKAYSVLPDDISHFVQISQKTFLKQKTARKSILTFI